MGWILLIVGLLIAGYATSWSLLWLLTWRTDGEKRDMKRGQFKHQWVVVLIPAATYFVIIGTAAHWKP
jgi:hypothetical protein